MKGPFFKILQTLKKKHVKVTRRDLNKLRKIRLDALLDGFFATKKKRCA